jgi:hypothetical protein
METCAGDPSPPSEPLSEAAYSKDLDGTHPVLVHSPPSVSGDLSIRSVLAPSAIDSPAAIIPDRGFRVYGLGVLGV